ncbi:MAG: hypothetical protein V1875_01625 [Candidatus Altiarchaeota archaeon]
MVSPVMSFEDFMQKLRTEVPAEIERENEKIKRKKEDELPQLFEIRPDIRQRSLLLNPKEAQTQLKGLIENQGRVERFLDVVSAVREEKVEIAEVQQGHRADNRDFILKGRNPDTGLNVQDLRILLGIPERAGKDVLNEATLAALFYPAIGLHTYNVRANLHPAEETGLPKIAKKR